jgi:YD repeat-containing protein
MLIAFYQTAFSQTSFPISTKLSESIPNSPEAINLNKFGLVPVTLYSGMTNVSIPLYEIQEGNIKVPITLSYYNKGFKPSEISGNTGLGWTLQSGGIITRIVRGQVDENPATDPVYDPESEFKMKYEDFPDILHQRFSQRLLKEISDGKSDGEPDIYTLNFNGYSGKFVLKNGQAYLTPKQNLKVTYSKTAFGSTFCITTEDGTKYTFGEGGNEWTEPNDFHAPMPVQVLRYISSWRLTSISSFDNLHTINYSYEDVILGREDYLSDSYHLVYSSGVVIPSGTFSRYYNYGANITSKSLLNITTNHCKIFFDKGASRTDLNQAYTPSPQFTLGKLRIETNAGDFIKQWQFIYEYFGQSTITKLKLKNLYQSDLSGMMTNKYSFDYYNETDILPDEKTNGIDHWGYYNGKINNMTKIPPEILPNGTMGAYVPGDRTPNSEYSKYCVLKKVTYPTKGYSYFEYENNRCNSSELLKTQKNASMYASYEMGTPVWDVVDGKFYVRMNSEPIYICDKQSVNFNYNFSTPNFRTDSKILPGIFIIRKIATTCEDISFLRSNQLNELSTFETPVYESPIYPQSQSISKTLELEPGTYQMELKLDETINSIDCYFSYYTTDGQTMELGALGAGIRILNIKNCESDSTKLLEKKYEYLTDNGESSGQQGGYMYPKSSYIENIYYINTVEEKRHEILNGHIENDLGSILNERYYYSKVSEYSVGTSTNLKTDFYYQSFQDVNCGIELVKQVDYNYINSKYKKIYTKEYQYSIVDEDMLMPTLSSSLEGTHSSGEAGAGISKFENYNDILDTEPHYFEFFKENSDMIPFAMKKLTAETNKTYKYNSGIEEPTDSITEVKTFKYSNLNPINPYEIQTNLRPTKSAIENTTYCYDLKIGDIDFNTPDSIESEYLNSLTEIINTYYNCQVSIISRCNYCAGDPNNFKICVDSTPNATNCLIDYYNAYRQLKSAKESQINTFYSLLTARISSETDLNNKAILKMQAGKNLVTPIEKKNYLLTGGNKKFLGAAKNVFSTVSDNIVGKEVWTYDLQIPIDSASFNSSNYVMKLAKEHDSYLNLVNEKLAYDTNHSYIWGYNNTLLIVKIDGIAYSDISSSLKSNITNRVYTSSTSYAAVKTDVDYLKGQLASLMSDPRYLVTFYTYSPLVGMTSQTAPNGTTTYFEYDNFGRLTKQVNNDGQLLKKNNYHYVTD